MEAKKSKRLIIAGILAIVGFIVILIAAVIFVLSISRNNLTPNDISTSGDLTSQPILEVSLPQKPLESNSCTITSKPSTESTSAYEVTLTTPVVSGCDSNAQDDLNQYIFDAMNQSVREVKFTDPNLAVGKNTITLNYKVTFNTKDFISIMISGYLYTGGAHGSTIFIPINYDMINNKNLDISQLGNSSLISKLSSYSISALKTKLNDSSLDPTIESGASANAENFKLFNVNPNNLEITFGEYQVGPYAIGAQKLQIPWSEIKSYLTTDFKNLVGI